MLYIVGYWHLFNYTSAFPKYHNPLTVRVTVIVLALFTLVSGYLLGKKDIGLSIRPVLAFYKARLARIYPPFAVTLGFFYLIGLVPAEAVLPSLALFAMFKGPPPSTLWFVTMIVCFYLMAPFLAHARGRSGSIFAALCVIISMAMVLVHQLTSTSDIRMVMYFPSFALGIYLADKNILELRRALPLLLTLTVGSALLGRLDSQSPESSYLSTPLAAFGSLTIFLLLAPVEFKKGPLISALTQLSSASYFMYLTHRVIYYFLHAQYRPGTPLVQLLYLAGIGIPAIIAMSWLLQHHYDRLVKRFL
jgi:peptidoglycan/LPS O-acetylase OafA/YrhL